MRRVASGTRLTTEPTTFASWRCRAVSSRPSETSKKAPDKLRHFYWCTVVDEVVTLVSTAQRLTFSE
ncbi:hypothetical protein H7Y63_01055 [Polaromonas sp.]|nr:hypothetical protein [Candidatus Saccharibacteria bacterium]